MYDRQAVLQSTSEPVGGLEHTLCWRPSGNLIAGTQRFGFEGGGLGKEGRHDVVFFERNGLRHGEFTIRPEHLKKGYRVRELIWSSDSNVLAVWFETSVGDIGELHWFATGWLADRDQFSSGPWGTTTGISSTKSLRGSSPPFSGIPRLRFTSF